MVRPESCLFRPGNAEERGGSRRLAQQARDENGARRDLQHARGTYEIYREDDVDALLQELQRADRVIGYNVVDFDFEVLAPYSVFDLSQVPVLDLMRDVEKTIGSRIGLDAISEQTLGCGKTADGMEALKWWKEGKLDARSRSTAATT